MNDIMQQIKIAYLLKYKWSREAETSVNESFVWKC